MRALKDSTISDEAFFCYIDEKALKEPLSMKKHALPLFMIALILLAASGLFAAVRVFRAQEKAIDSMMRSYLINVSAGLNATEMPYRGRKHRMRYRMLTASPVLRGDAGGQPAQPPGGPQAPAWGVSASGTRGGPCAVRPSPASTAAT